MGVNYGNRLSTVTDGLLMYLDAGNRKSYVDGSPIWKDLSENNNHASVIGQNIFYNSNYGGSLDLTTNQSTSYISLPSLPFNQITSTYTLEFWIRPKTTRTGYFFSVSDGTNHNYMLLSHGSNSLIGVNGGSGPVPYYNDEILQFCMVRNGSDTGLLYKNGKFVTNSTLVTALTNANPNGCIMGQEQDALGGGFDGGQSYLGSYLGFKLYNRALSEIEILKNFRSVSWRYGL